MALGASAVLLVPGVAGAANPGSGALTINSQGGNHATNLQPGDSIYAGYSFQYPGQGSGANYPPGAITVFKDGQAVLSVSCPDNSVPSQSSVTVPMPYQSYDGTQTSNGWFPTGDQTSFLSYQGSLQMPSLCPTTVANPTGTMVVGKQTMGPFTAMVYTSATSYPTIQVRWHYGDAATAGAATGTGTGSSWSGTASVDPADISGVPAAPALGMWAPVGIAVALVFGAGSVVWFRRSRAAHIAKATVVAHEG
jgi:hypothetical protein